jgi:hypothetical protein
VARLGARDGSDCTASHGKALGLEDVDPWAAVVESLVLGSSRPFLSFRHPVMVLAALCTRIPERATINP